MRKAGFVLLTVLVPAGQLAVSYTVCRNFLAPQECAQPEESCALPMEPMSSDSERCAQICALGRDEIPALTKKPEVDFSLTSLEGLPVRALPVNDPARRRLLTWPSPRHGPLANTKVYLLHSSLLI